MELYHVFDGTLIISVLLTDIKEGKTETKSF